MTTLYNHRLGTYIEVSDYESELDQRVRRETKVLSAPYDNFKERIHKNRAWQLIESEINTIILATKTYKEVYYNKLLLKKRFGNVFQLYGLDMRPLKVKEIYPLGQLEYHLSGFDTKEKLEEVLKQDVLIQLNYKTQEYEFVTHFTKFDVFYYNIYESNEETDVLLKHDKFTNPRIEHLLYNGKDFLGDFELQFLNDYHPEILKYNELSSWYLQSVVTEKTKEE